MSAGSATVGQQDVVSLLKENGIGQRSVSSVWSKIYRIERQWENANAWLKNSGLLDAYQAGEVDDEIRASVNKLCPRFNWVSPVFRNARMGTDEAAATDEHEAADDSDSEHGSQLVTQKAAMTTKESAKKFDIEDEGHQHRQKLFQCEYEAKRAQADVEIVCARVLGRQRLLNAGVDPKVVDDVLPSA
ncbi:hypothetical protein PR003_g4505 [Phytophthora rubi]|uniref:Uncharacterized protein n=1 Tax=Phytophthora rubi TaxID=129364 RepID=A0A6A3H1C8_9STRA|nr:hypothetical protein PR002_g29416 [Phytophthora rubi]KAE8963329.1 hypothetical protein PR001_g29411 [Phytophthora rubi]KAE9352185.1 hypothetical protein PR003_g4505 [Phytophthora rubi]